MKNNSNFYHRADAGNVPHLADAANLGIYYIAQDVTRKIANTLTKHIGWADNAVLVAAFKTIADEVRKENPGMPEEEVLKKSERAIYGGLVVWSGEYRSGIPGAFL